MNSFESSLNIESLIFLYFNCVLIRFLVPIEFVANIVIEFFEFFEFFNLVIDL